MITPSYLSRYSELYSTNPREANRKWFAEAKYGLFLHYGLYSILGQHEWVQYRKKIRVQTYAKLMERFTAEHFDADRWAQFAVDCGMHYINITTRHHDSFCLWDTKYTDFNSMQSPAHRDLVRELADACVRHGLGIFLYYSHGRDWRHPHAPNLDKWDHTARPHYHFPREKTYAYGKDHNLQIYVDFIQNQIGELLRNYPTVAGIWLDGISTPLGGDYTQFKVPELYDFIRHNHPHALISYKQGLIGTEDYFAPEHQKPQDTHSNRAGKIYDHPDKLCEICTTMTIKPSSWGYYQNAQHRSAENVLHEINRIWNMDANILLNTGPLPDGSIDPQDDRVLRDVGKILKK